MAARAMRIRFAWSWMRSVAAVLIIAVGTVSALPIASLCGHSLACAAPYKTYCHMSIPW